jgi:hypothetical protein
MHSAPALRVDWSSGTGRDRTFSVGFGDRLALQRIRSHIPTGGWPRQDSGRGAVLPHNTASWEPVGEPPPGIEPGRKPSQGHALPLS